MRIERLTENESVVVQCLGRDGRVFEHNPEVLREGASVTKVFYAMALVRMIEKGEVLNEPIAFGMRDVQAYGTNVLKDVLIDGGGLQLRTMVLVRLMLKYSCNASTDILFRRYFSGRGIMERYLDEFGVEGAKPYDDQGDWVNLWSADNYATLFERLYGAPRLFGELGEEVRKSLVESTNKYYLFDQLPVNVLGSKTGLVSNSDGVQVSNFGVVEIGDNQYLMGAMVHKETVREAVLEIRRIGREIYTEIK